ncbi:MAG: hypothetical protein BGO49_05395 [Planctomycetales bacterium 71-10]|nr:MAG: hypothetical protein BGO49_05395 [Planctomycetales bacterium 71-10]
MTRAGLTSLTWCLLAAVAVAGDDPSSPPWSADFRAEELAAPWRVVADEGGAASPRDGGLAVKAERGARAHVERPLGRDLVTIAAKLGRWGSIDLVWGPDDWCGVGKVSPTPFGRFSTAVVRGGEADEEDHRGLDFGSLQHVRIELGEDYVRFSNSADGKTWEELRTIERPASFAGAPKLLAAGRWYEAAERPFADAAADRARTEITPLDGWVGDLRVEATPEAATRLGEAGLKALREPKIDPVMATLVGDDDDPTFEKIAGKFPAMKHPREIVGVPAHPLDIGVDRLGRLDVSPWTPPLAWFEVGDPPAPLGREGVPFRRRLLHGYLPVLTLNTTRDGVDYELTVFGANDGFRPDRDLVAYVGLAARPADGSPAPPLALAWAGGRRPIPTEAGADGWARGFLSFTYPKPDAATPIGRDEFEAKAREVAAFWEAKLAPAARFDVPDPRVAEAYRAWLVYSLLNADTIDGRIEAHDGAGFYEEIFGCSMSLHSRAVDLYGLSGYAEQLLDTQLHFQRPDGLYTQACGLTDPGSLLVALSRHFAMTGDAEWLRRVAPNVVRQCDWLRDRRAEAEKEGKLRGLIKFRPYNDLQHPTYNYLGNAWCARGMAEAAEALARIGHADAPRIAAEAAAYRKDVLDSMAAFAFQDRGLTLLDMEPDTRRLLKLSRNRGGDYYGLVACSLLETDFLTPDQDQARWIVDLVEKRGGLVAGVSEFQTGIDHAYTYGYLIDALRKDEPRKVLLGFWSFLAFGMTRDTYSPVEVSMIRTGENHYTLPHLYSCTEQLRLLRDLLVFEQGDALWLGKAAPRGWLEAGKHVAVESAPTEFGPVSYRVDAQADGSMRVRIDPPTRRPPAEIKLRLRHPEGRPIAAVETTPSAPPRVEGDVATFRDLKNPIDLVVRFRAD